MKSYDVALLIVGTVTRLARLRSWRAWRSSAVRASSAWSLRSSTSRLLRVKWTIASIVPPSTTRNSVETSRTSTSVKPS
jgi:hypothetical protein